jgi:hypothetical protein
MQLDRALQHKILTELTDCFPNPSSQDFFDQLIAQHSQDHVLGNLLYLDGHGLIKLKTDQGLNHKEVLWTLTEPTVQAFDFLANDGGLSAILNNGTAKPDNHAGTDQANKFNQI